MSEILPYNPLAQITETFSWQTAVNPAWSAEERIALRDDPRLEITYSYAIDSDAKLADFYAFSETNLGIPVRVPMWSSPHFHPGSVLSAATSFSLSGSLLHYYLYPGDEVILWKSTTSYIPLVISTISSSSISFTTSIGSNFSAFYILPLLTGRFNKAMNFTKGSGSRKRAGFVFDVLNFVLPDPYSGYRVDKVLQSTEFSTATKQDRELVKSELGVYENLPTSDLIKESWRGGFNFASPSDLVDFLILLKVLKGRAVSFTFPYDFLSPTGTSTVFSSSDSITIEHSFPRRAAASIELEGSPIPTYELYANASTVTEGQTLGFSVLTTQVPDGTTLYYTVLDITTEGISDITPISGSVTIVSGSATFDLSILLDFVTEGNETFQVELRTDSISGTVVATSGVVSIVDTTLTGQGITKNWRGGSASSDGTISAFGTVSGDYIYVSTDGGVTRTARHIIAGTWNNTAMSSDGTIMYACSFGVTDGYIAKSTDGGLTWSNLAVPSTTWAWVACSSSGQYVTVPGAGTAQAIYTSNDYGATWVARSGNTRSCRTVCMSASGQYQIIGRSWSALRSSDYGVTWTETGLTTWSQGKVCCSSDGSKVTLGSANGYLYTSTDYGVTWTQRGLVRAWNSIVCSASGETVVAGVAGGYLFLSTDSGTTWTQLSVPLATWAGLAGSSDLSKLYAAFYGSYIYTT